jgi:hypothetical protein
VWTRPSSPWGGEMDEGRVASFLGKLALKHPDTFWTARNPAYFRWRYAVGARRTYGAVVLEDRGDIVAMLFYGTARRPGLHEVQVLDALAVTEAALRSALRKLVEQEDPDWVVFAGTPRFPLLPALRRCGLVPLPRRADLVAREVANPYSAPLVATLGLSLGDLDTF